ncbi:acyl-CoA-binding domain-containing protein 4-like [Crotalus adamanteus]|uniref:Acyl-CoA-binding domain-containing protein 4-like n=1 Tax=Crotalus adamanteus TaxID=8729 RepID=A0AAW1C945_CROAD
MYSGNWRLIMTFGSLWISQHKIPYHSVPEAKGKVPTLAFHSATVYRKEVFVFGGAFSKMLSLERGACSNALFIFNPDYEIWYQPIVEGEKPLPRLG